MARHGASVVALARLLLGFDLFVNGLSWWWKILPYPSVNEVSLPQTPHIVQAMIDTGYMFGLIKVIEVVAGIALLANACVPLTLVIAFPVTVAAWSVDAFILSSSLRANVLGWGTLLPHCFLLTAYLRSYWPMIAFQPQTVFESLDRSSPEALPTGLVEQQSIRTAVLAFGFLATVVALLAVIWLSVLIVRRLLGAH